VKVSNGVFISWRLLGTDSRDVSFNLYRNGTLVNGTPLTSVTSYLDTAGSNSSSYQVRSVVDGQEQASQSQATVWAQPYSTINLNIPSGGTTPDGVAYTYSPNDLSVGDVDGDGQYEIFLKWEPSNAKDNSQSGYTGNVFIDAYRLSGERLWRIDLGRNIRAGAHYTQFMVYDFDGDGKAEMVLRTADGTRDAAGTVIGNASADYRNSSGYILTGPEYLTVFEGATGRIRQTITFPIARGGVGDWGNDTYGNRVDRFLAGVAYLDGQRPSMIFSRGYYEKTVISALDWRNGQLTQRWLFTADGNQNQNYRGQGAHSLSVADVDNDGRHEIIFGAAAIDDNGRGLYTTNLGHGDALHVTDIIPSRPGLEVFMVHECPSCYGNHGVEVHDARTGQILYSGNGNAEDVGRGLAADVDARYPGMEVWGSRNGLFTSGGQEQSTKPSLMNFAIWWDGDLLRELLDGTTIAKWNQGSLSTLLNAGNNGAASNNGTKSTPALSADLFGDWREEVIFRNSNNSQLMIYTTTASTNYRFYTLMHDPQYRVAIAWQNTAYNQPPHPGFFLGDGMTAQPVPDISTPR
jgi:rhamnogalacturonan endolyase